MGSWTASKTKVSMKKLGREQEEGREEGKRDKYEGGKKPFTKRFCFS